MLFLLTPLREGRPRCFFRIRGIHYFYSRPCGRGDYRRSIVHLIPRSFLLTPLREGRPAQAPSRDSRPQFLLTPLREGRRWRSTTN